MQKKQLDEALAHYNKAIELDPQEISFLTNRAAVLFEQGKYDDCIKARERARRARHPRRWLTRLAGDAAQDCDDAVEKGQLVRADFKARNLAAVRACLARADAHPPLFSDAGARDDAQGQRAPEEGRPRGRCRRVQQGAQSALGTRARLPALTLARSVRSP